MSVLCLDSIQQICYHENLNMAGLACGVYVNVTMVMLSSHVQDEDSKYTCQETAELIVSTIVALSGCTEPPNTSILKVKGLLKILFSMYPKGATNCSCEIIFCQWCRLFHCLYLITSPPPTQWYLLHVEKLYCIVRLFSGACFSYGLCYGCNHFKCTGHLFFWWYQLWVAFAGAKFNQPWLSVAGVLL